MSADRDFDALFEQLLAPQLAPLLTGLESLAANNPILAGGLREVVDAIKDFGKTAIKTELDLEDELERLRRQCDAWRTTATNGQRRIDALIALRNELMDRPNGVATLSELDSVLLRAGAP